MDSQLEEVKEELVSDKTLVVVGPPYPRKKIISEILSKLSNNWPDPKELGIK